MASYDGITGGRKDCLLAIGAKVLADTRMDAAQFASKMKSLTGIEMSARDFRRLRIDSAHELGKKINPGKSYSADVLVQGRAGIQSREILQARDELADFLNRIENRSAVSVVRHLIKSGGLVNVPKRLVFDPLGNAINAARLEFARAPAWLVNTVFIPSKRGLIDTPFFSEGFVRGVKSGFSKGLKESGQILKTGKVDEVRIRDNWLTKFNQSGELVWGGNAGTLAANIGFRMTRALDRPGFWHSFDRSITEQAKYLSQKIGKIEGWDAARTEKEYRHLLDNPTDEMVFHATDYADEAVFQNKNKVAEVASRAKQYLRESKTGEAADMVAEAIFSGWRYPHIPSNVAGVAFEPLLGGGSAEIGKLAVSALRGTLKDMSDDQLRHLLMLFGKKSTGIGVMAAGYYMYQNGMAEPIYWEFGRKKVMVGVRFNFGGKEVDVPTEEVGGAFLWMNYGVMAAENAAGGEGIPATATRLATEGYVQQLSTTGAAEQFVRLTEGGVENAMRTLGRAGAKAAFDIVPGSATVTEIARRMDTPDGPLSMGQPTARKPSSWEDYIFERLPGLRERVGRYE